MNQNVRNHYNQLIVCLKYYIIINISIKTLILILFRNYQIYLELINSIFYIIVDRCFCCSVDTTNFVMFVYFVNGVSETSISEVYVVLHGIRPVLLDSLCHNFVES